MNRSARFEKVEGGYIVTYYDNETGYFETQAIFTEILPALVKLAAIFEPMAGVTLEDLVDAIAETLAG